MPRFYSDEARYGRRRSVLRYPKHRHETLIPRMPDGSLVTFHEHLIRENNGWHMVEYTSVAIKPKVTFSIGVFSRRSITFDEAATAARIEFKKWIEAGCPPQAKPDQGEG